MEENSLKRENTESIKDFSVDQNDIAEATPTPLRKLYFINEIVEWHLTLYLWTGCTKIILRDMIMSNATELITQIIRKQGLHTIYPGQDESSFGDLLQTAWVQIERTLYKYRSRPHCRKCFNADRPSDSLLYQPGQFEYGIKSLDDVVHLSPQCPRCRQPLATTPIQEPSQGTYGGSDTILYRGMSKVFNMWSQIARTVILAHIKKEGRDRKNSGSYVGHLSTKHRPVSGTLERFLSEAREINKYDANHQKIVNALEHLILNDDRPHDGLIGKLVEKSRLPRNTVTNFLQLLRVSSFEFTDSVINRANSELKMDSRRSNVDDEE